MVIILKWFVYTYILILFKFIKLNFIIIILAILYTFIKYYIYIYILKYASGNKICGSGKVIFRLLIFNILL